MCYSWKTVSLEHGKYCLEPKSTATSSNLTSFSTRVLRSSTMGKRAHITRVIKTFCHPSKASAFESASNTSGIVLKPRSNEPTEKAYGATLDRLHDASVRNLWDLALEELSSEDKETMSKIKDTEAPMLEALKHLSSVVANYTKPFIYTGSSPNKKNGNQPY